jgi:hypothetical protein
MPAPRALAPPAGRLQATPIFRSEARAFVAKHHSHNHPPSVCVFQIGAEVDGVLVGVVMAGIPNARRLAEKRVIIEITRVATDSTPNACSLLYARACQAARALGFRRAVTYTLASERGTALRATGWMPDPELLTHNPHAWQTQKSRRAQTVDLFGATVPLEPKRRWWKTL